jgi:hypothetical protein
VHLTVLFGHDTPLRVDVNSRLLGLLFTAANPSHFAETASEKRLILFSAENSYVLSTLRQAFYLSFATFRSAIAL